MHPEDVRKYNCFNIVVCHDYITSVRISSTSTSILSCAVTTRHPAARALCQPRRTPRVLVSWSQRLYLNYTARPGASAHRAARRRLLRLRRASGCLGSSRGPSLTASPTLCVRVPRLVARLIVDYFAHVARPGASARRAAHRRLLCLHCASGCLGSCAARRRLLRLHRAFGCLGSSHGSSSTTSLTSRVRVPQLVAWLVVDYFAYVARPGASARRAATNSPTSCVRVPRLVTRPVVDYFAYATRPGASAHRRLLRLHRAFGWLGLLARRRLLGSHRASGCLSS
jgi:hypothetical protein